MSLKPRRVDFDETWLRLRETVEAVVTLKKVDRDVWNARFFDIYTLCIALPESFANVLYLQTKEFLEEHVKGMVKAKNAHGCKSEVGEDLLQRYYDAWSEYSRGIDNLNRLYSSYNQLHIREQKNSNNETFFDIDAVKSIESMEVDSHMEIREVGLNIWRLYAVENLSNQLVDMILQGISADRRGDASLNSHRVEVIKGVVLSFIAVQNRKPEETISLELYQLLFEQRMLTASVEYFQDKAAQLQDNCTVSKYMEEVLSILENEKQRAHKLLHPTSIPKVTHLCEMKSIYAKVDFLHSEHKEIMASESRKDLRNMYVMLKPIPVISKTFFINTLLHHIKNEAQKKISALEGENIHIQFVENMLEVREKYVDLIAEVFESDARYLCALDKALTSIVNWRPDDKQPCQSAEYVAKYCDAMLRKSKTLEPEVDTKLTNSIMIFKYIQDKDKYQKWYGRFLAKRLINEQSHSMDLEESMLDRLKQTCGYEFTKKLQRMLTDMSVSADLNCKFNDFLQNKQTELGLNFSIKVLQSGAWPIEATIAIPFVLPQEFEKPMQLFEMFYGNSFKGRKLTWLHPMCHGELRVEFLQKTYIVTMQMYQMAIMLCFEHNDALTCKEIQDSLQLSAETLQKHMQSLLDSKLLTTSDASLNDKTKIELNFEYSNKRSKFRITNTFEKATQPEDDHTQCAVNKDRKLYLQAAIVRIIKGRKILKHTALVNEVLSLADLTFAPSVGMIKKCIESLIEMQYLERTPNATDEYCYVA